MSKIKAIPAHPFADIDPLEEDTIEKLGEDIQENGQRLPCLTFQGKLLDGRRRQLACIAKGIPPVYKEFRGSALQALRAVHSLNYQRRHYQDASERAQVAARFMIEMEKLAPKTPPEANGKAEPAQMQSTVAEVAADHNVSPRLLHSALKVEREGSKELKAAVADGTLAVGDAAHVADQPAKVQKKAIKAVKSGKARTIKAVAPKPKKKKSGQIKFDDKALVDALGKVIRLVDERAEMFPRGDDFRAMHDHLDKALLAFRRWQAASK